MLENVLSWKRGDWGRLAIGGKLIFRAGPTDVIVQPTFIRRLVEFRLVEGAGVDLEPIGKRRIKESEWSAAVAAERALPLRKMQQLWSAVEP